MSIQFNKVTWYSIVVAIIVLIGTIFLASYIFGQYKEVSLLRQSVSSSVKKVPANGDVALMVGEVASFDGLLLTFDELTQDSRCPVDVKCIQAGTVTARVNLKSGEKVEETDLVSDKVIYRFSNYAITVVRAAPVRHSDVEIDPKNYIAVFHITNILGS